MKQNKKVILFSTLAIVCILLLILVNFYLNRVTMNPEGTIGNTAGNIHNGGLFCEYDGYVYFSNVNDDNCLYRMRPDETEMEKFLPVKPGNILAGGDYLYFFQYGVSGETGLGSLRSGHNFQRVDLDGKHVVSMETDVVVTAQLVDNYLYMLISDNENPIFRKIKIDRKDKTDLANYAVNPACAKNGIIYYYGTTSNHYLYTLNTSRDSVSEYLPNNVWYPTIDGDYIYYLDIENNYRLCRYVMSSGYVEVLTNERIDCFNVGNGYIYYQVASKTAPALKMMSTDGRTQATIAEGNYTNIHLTSKYVYFREFHKKNIMYHAPIGSTVYSSM